MGGGAHLDVTFHTQQDPPGGGIKMSEEVPELRLTVTITNPSQDAVESGLRRTERKTQDSQDSKGQAPSAGATLSPAPSGGGQRVQGHVCTCL